MKTKSYKLFLIIIMLHIVFSSACTDSDKQVNSHTERGIDFIENQQPEKARIEFKNVLQIDPLNGKAYYYLGHLEEQRGELASAIRNYTRSLDLNPKLIEPHISLGEFYLFKAGALKNNNDTRNRKQCP